MHKIFDDKLVDAKLNNWVDQYAHWRVRPYLKLSRLDRPIGSWLLIIPCWWGLLLSTNNNFVCEVTTNKHKVTLLFNKQSKGDMGAATNGFDIVQGTGPWEEMVRENIGLLHLIFLQLWDRLNNTPLPANQTLGTRQE